MSDVEIPLGRKEGSRLEFKSGEALKDRPAIGREVVAMLNAGGGEVWVGLGEEAELAVRVEPIEHAEREARALHDFLVDSIEPSPTDDEVTVETAPAEGGEVLRVTVRPEPERRPYALLKAGGRHYVLRVGSRLRPMSREEILAAPGGAGEVHGGERSTASESILAALDESRATGRELFWMGVVAPPGAELKLGALLARDYFLEPERTAVRRAGRTVFSSLHAQPPRLGMGVVEVGREGSYHLRVSDDGGLFFSAPLRALGGPITGWPDVEGTLFFDPLALLEIPVSLFRLLGAMLRDRALWNQEPTRGPFAAMLAMLGAGGWGLVPGRPRLPIEFMTRRHSIEVFAQQDLILDRPLHFDRTRLEQEPDLCAFRLVQKVYEAFGLAESDIPGEFDRGTGRLILPE